MNSNDPAFPGISHSYGDNDVVDGHVQPYTALSTYGGLTIRAEFAKAAMQGILSNPNVNPLESGDVQINELSTFFADSLIRHLNKTEK